MALLEYDIRVVGADSVSKALAGIEARLRQHSNTVSRLTGASPAAAKKLTGTGAASSVRSALNAEAREKAKAARDEIRLRNQVNAVNVRGVQQEMRLRERTAKVEKRHAQEIARQRVEFAKETLGHGASRVTNTVKAVGSAGAAMLGVGGAALAASSVASAARTDEQVRRLIINAREGGTTSKYDPGQLTGKINQTGIETGINPEEIVGGLQAFVTKTGDLDTAVKNMKVFSQVAQATGASVSDIASASADLSEKMGIKDVDQMAASLATLTFQGKKGAFEIRDLAQYLPEISAAASTFGVKGVGGITQLGGLMQVARSSTGSGAEAATSVEAMFRQMTAKSGKIQSGEAFGGNKVSVFEGNDPTKPLRDFQAILVDIISASKGNLVQLQDVFDVRGIRAVNPLISEYRNANNAAGGGKKGDAAGRAAIMGKLSDAANVKGDFSEIQKDASAAMQSFSVQMETMNTEMKLAISSEIMPELMKLGPQLKELVPYVGRAAKMFVDLVGFFMNHPFASLATIVGVQLAADFAAARLGSLASAGLEKMMSKIPGGGGGAIAPGNRIMGGTTGAGMLGAAGTGAAIGLTIGSAIIAANLVQFEKGEADMKTAGQRLNAIRDMTPEQAGEARKLVEQQRSVVNETNKPGFLESIVGRGAAQMVGAAPSETEVNTQTAFLAEMETKLAMLERAAKSMENASGNLNGAAGKTAMNVPNRGATPSPIKAY